MTPWIPWSGGECPVAEDARVDVKFRDGCIVNNAPCGRWEWQWDHDHSDFHIIAYRVLSADGGEGE